MSKGLGAVCGHHFRRQAPIKNYIVDFACFSQRVVIELDGIQHHEPSGRRKDAARDPDLTWRGFKVLRFRNGDVSETPEGVMLEILAALGVVERPSDTGQRISCVIPHPYPLPARGRGAGRRLWTGRDRSIGHEHVT